MELQRERARHREEVEKLQKKVGQLEAACRDRDQRLATAEEQKKRELEVAAAKSEARLAGELQAAAAQSEARLAEELQVAAAQSEVRLAEERQAASAQSESRVAEERAKHEAREAQLQEKLNQLHEANSAQQRPISELQRRESGAETMAVAKPAEPASASMAESEAAKPSPSEEPASPSEPFGTAAPATPAAPVATEMEEPTETASPGEAAPSAPVTLAVPVAEAEEDDDDGDDEDDDGMGRDELNNQIPAELAAELDELVNAEVWRFACQKLDIDPRECKDIYRTIQGEYRSGSAAEGYPLKAFLEELKVEMDDYDGVNTVASAVTDARARLLRGDKKGASGSRAAMLTMFDKVVRRLDELGRPAEEAWSLVQEGEVRMSTGEDAEVKAWTGHEEAFVQRVKHYMLQPPMVNATAGQVVCGQRCAADVMAIIRRCKEDGAKYVDPEWDMTESPLKVLYVDGEAPGYDCTVAKPFGYKRLSDIVKNSDSGDTGQVSALSAMFGGIGSSAPKVDKKPALFKGGVKAGDIVQGQIGTCFLLGAMGSIAAVNGSDVQKFFIKYDVDIGVYGVRFNVDGEWTYTIVDDFFPVDENGELLYSRCKDPQEVWVPVLEKAFCKLHTCYEMCDGGQPTEAIFSFMGGVGGRFPVKRCDKRDPAGYFQVLQKSLSNGWLMTTGFRQQAGSGTRGAGKCGEGVLDNGLVAGHAYSILKVVEANGNKLVCCRNPWGTGEWTGKWSDSNDFGEWTDEIKELTGYQGLDDGKFWMSIEDFVANTTGVEYARTFGPNWKKVTQYARFSTQPVEGIAIKEFDTSKEDELCLTEGDLVEIISCEDDWFKGRAASGGEGFFPANCVRLGSRPVARFDLVGMAIEAGGPMTAVVMLLQGNAHKKRKFYTRKDGQNYKDTSYPNLQLVVRGPDGKVALQRGGSKRCVWGELMLPGDGLWRIYALSLDGTGARYSLRVYLKGGSATLTEVAGATPGEAIGDEDPLPTPELEPIAALPEEVAALDPESAIASGDAHDEACITQPVEEEAEDSDDEDVRTNLVSMEQATLSAEALAELEDRIDATLWRFICRELHIDANEGKEVWRTVQGAYRGGGANGYPLKAIMEELKVDMQDVESVSVVVRAVAKARAQLARRDKVGDAVVKPRSREAMMTMFNKVVRVLDRREESASAAWTLVQEGVVPMSKAEEIEAKAWSGSEEAFKARVEHYMVQPPVINATAGQTGCSQRCTAEVEGIIARCQAEGANYIDPDWSMEANPTKVLYVDQQQPGYDCTVGEPAGYRRLTDIVKDATAGQASALAGLFGGMGSGAPRPAKKPVLFKGGIKAGDILQGQIGTCFLLGAMGSLAAVQAADVQKFFIKWDVDVGVYGVRFNVDGEWTHVIVDDFFPVDENGELLYSRCKDPQEVWVPILEKAFCKLHTCYEMCDGGQPSEAIFSFMGGVSGTFQVKRKDQRDPSGYFDLLQRAQAKGWLMTTTFKKKAGGQSQGAGKCGEGVLDNGLVAGHAYSLLKVMEAGGQRLVCCRNPWGTGEWTGKWSDENAHGEWTEEMKELTGYQGLDDGKFWMSIEDFVANTGGVDYSRTFGPNWKKVTQYARFLEHPVEAIAIEDYYSSKRDELSLSAGDRIRISSCASDWWKGRLKDGRDEGFFPAQCVRLTDRPVSRFDLVGTPDEGAEGGTMTAVVMLMQDNAMMQRKFYKRRHDGLNYKDTSYSKLQLIVVGPDGKPALRQEGSKRCVWGELMLPGGGLWRIYALSVDGSRARYSLRIYLKGGVASLTEVSGASVLEATGGAEPVPAESAPLLGPLPADVEGLGSENDNEAETEQPEDEGNDDDDDDDNDGVSREQIAAEEPAPAPAASSLEGLEDLVNLDAWKLACRTLGIDAQEGQEIFDNVKDDFFDTDGEGGYPVKCFVQELKLDAQDSEGIGLVIKAVVTAKAKLEQGSRNDDVSAGMTTRPAMMTMFDKVVRALDRSERSAEEAWTMVEEGGVLMSKAEEAEARAWSGYEEAFIKKVQRYMVQPPVVNATAGQTVCTQRCVAEVAAIVERCEADGEGYVDPDWNMQGYPAKVLYVDMMGPGYDCTVGEPAGYKRLPEIVKAMGNDAAMSALGGLFGGMGGGGARPSRKPLLFKGGVKAGDILQGQIGTCFLLGAMGSIASVRESDVQKFFIAYDVDIGVYGVRFNVDGEWTYTIIDDYFPVDENGELLYARCKDSQEVWVPLLEKAYCKLHTCYEMCDGGQPAEAIFSFLGGVNGNFAVRRKDMRDPAQYFRLMQQAFNKGWLMTTGFKKQQGRRSQSAGKCGEGVSENGLVCGHAYSVLKIVEGGGHQLVCCRNPWGTGEWTGKWSDENADGEWTDEMKQLTGYQGLDDGKFWMSIEDFVANTTGVDYARTFGPNWSKVTQYARFLGRKLEAEATQDFYSSKRDELSFSEGDRIQITSCTSDWWSGRLDGGREEGFFPSDSVRLLDRPVARFDLVGTPEADQGPMTAVVMLMQANAMMRRKFYKRKSDGLNYKDTSYQKLQLCVVGPDGSVALKKEGSKRCVWGELTLSGGGVWRIYALCVDGSEAKYSLRVYLKGGTAALTEVSGATYQEITGEAQPVSAPELPPEDEFPAAVLARESSGP